MRRCLDEALKQPLRLLSPSLSSLFTPTPFPSFSCLFPFFFFFQGLLSNFIARDLGGAIGWCTYFRIENIVQQYLLCIQLFQMFTLRWSSIDFCWLSPNSATVVQRRLVRCCGFVVGFHFSRGPRCTTCCWFAVHFRFVVDLFYSCLYSTLSNNPQ